MAEDGRQPVRRSLGEVGKTEDRRQMTEVVTACYRVNANAPGRIRTCGPLIKSQLPENDNLQQNKDLQKDQNVAYKPAYKPAYK